MEDLRRVKKPRDPQIKTSQDPKPNLITRRRLTSPIFSQEHALSLFEVISLFQKKKLKLFQNFF